MGPEKEDEHGATELKLHIITWVDMLLFVLQYLWLLLPASCRLNDSLTAESGLNIPLQMSIFNPVEGSVGE
eukprot:scaffold102977_cov16-Tisochrysis_lutea.AAC.1